MVISYWHLKTIVPETGKETSARNEHYSLRNNPEELISLFWSLSTHNLRFCWNRTRVTDTTFFLILNHWALYRCKECSPYRPGVTQRVGRCIALLIHDRGTRSGWVVSSTPWPHFTPGKDPVSFIQEGGWAPGPVWTGENSHPHRPARSQSLYRLSYRAHSLSMY